MSAHRRLTTIAAFVLALAIALLPGVATAQEDAPGPRWIQLLWDAPSVDAGTLVEHAAEHSDLQITTIARWDNADQRWLLWRLWCACVRQRFHGAGAGLHLLVLRDLYRLRDAGVRHPAASRTKDELVIEEEHSREGYDRGLFRHWIDADGDGCDTRREVLIRDAVETPTVGERCNLSGGRWVSLYDGRVFTGDGGGLDMDHMVPLAEAWDSGAWAWSPERRRAFANDLEHRFALLAVSASSNRSKGARDPAEWMPPDASSHCLYATYWRDTKVAWGLTFDQAEVGCAGGRAWRRAKTDPAVRARPASPPPPSLLPCGATRTWWAYITSCEDSWFRSRSPGYCVRLIGR